MYCVGVVKYLVFVVVVLYGVEFFGMDVGMVIVEYVIEFDWGYEVDYVK